MAKLFRYRKPSIKTILGLTAAKKLIKKDLGITAALKPFRAWGNAKRRAKRQLGYYSPIGQILRNGLRTPFGMGRSRRRQSSLGGILGFLMIAVVGMLAIQGGCGSSDTKHEIVRAVPAPVAVDPNEAHEQPPSVEAIREVEPVAEVETPLPAIIARDWTDTTGTFHTSALFLSAIVDHVQLRKSNGATIEIPLTKLSDADLAYLRTIGVSTEPARTILGRIVGVSDGDTVTVLDDNKQQTKIRLEGIDAPENHQAFGAQSRKALGEKIFQKNVRVEWRGKDKYGRTLGHIFLDDAWINMEMVAEGWAWHYKKYSHDARLADAEDHARLEHLGLWISEIRSSWPPLRKRPHPRPLCLFNQRHRITDLPVAPSRLLALPDYRPAIQVHERSMCGGTTARTAPTSNLIHARPGENKGGRAPRTVLWCQRHLGISPIASALLGCFSCYYAAIPQSPYLIVSCGDLSHFNERVSTMDQIPFGPESLGTNSFADNPEPRCPCILLLDVSGSMQGAPISELNSGLAVYKDEVAADALAAKRVEVAIVTFGTTVQTLVDFTTAESFVPPTLQADGQTPMGSAINQAIDMIDQRKQTYRANGVGYFRPWIFMITDGGPTDEWKSAAARIKQGEAAKAFSFFAVAVEGANLEVLSQLSARTPLQLKGLRFRDLFLWLSRSQQSVSRSTPGDEVPLQNPATPQGWASV